MDVEGKPMLMSVALANTFEADFVLATLIEPTGDESESQATGASQSGSRNFTASADASTGAGLSGTSYSATRDTGLGTPSSGGSYKRRTDSQLATPPAKRPRLSPDENDDEENETMLWGKDLQNGILEDQDDSDVMSS